MDFHAQLNKIFENSNAVAYCILDKKNQIIFYNSHFLKMMSLPENLPSASLTHEIILGSLEKNYSPKRVLAFKKWLARKLKTDKTRFVLSNSNDDSFKQYLGEINHLNDPDTDEQFIILTFYDITEFFSLRNQLLSKGLKRDIQIARKIQKNTNNFIIPFIEGRFFKYEFQNIFIPSSLVSGDIIQIKQVNRRYTSLFVGDGRGHGISAAMYSALINSYLNMVTAKILEGSTELEKIWEKVNNLAYRDFSGTGEYYFFSGIYGLIDGNNKSMEIINGGHPPLILVENGKATEINADGTLFGIKPDSMFSSSTLELRDGQQYFFFTDGLYDIFLDNTVNQGTKLQKFVLEMVENELDQKKIAVEIQKYINSARGQGIVFDDISMLIMSVKGK